MRNVFLKTDLEECTTCTDALMHNLERRGMTPERAGEHEIYCNDYDIKLMGDREWLVLTATRPGTGYMTIPYNRNLLNPNGVAPENCNLKTLYEKVKEGIHN